MPRGDQTGPNGMGPMTGRAAGYCTGNGMPGFANSMFGNRGGFGRGMGLPGRKKAMKNNGSRISRMHSSKHWSRFSKGSIISNHKRKANLKGNVYEKNHCSPN